MAFHFTVLGSGSKGNASVISLNGRHLLIDPGFPARTLAARLAQAGIAPSDIDEAILTHTHSDHANGTAFHLLAKHNVTFWCHASHCAALSAREGFQQLEAQGLVQHYTEAPFESKIGLEIAPAALRHGAGETFGFRFSHHNQQAEQAATIGYLADVGSWSKELAVHFLGCNLLAVEFNHDVGMTLKSGRHPFLIQRNLSDDGHLSNVQAADLLKFILGSATTTRLSAIVLLHLSDSCNTIELAEAAARRAIRESTDDYIPVHVALQDEPLESIPVSYSQSAFEIIVVPDFSGEVDARLAELAEVSKVAPPTPQNAGRKKRGPSPDQMEFTFLT